MLGFRSEARAPEWLWCIERSRHLERVCEQLCDRLGPHADVRLYARRATRKGWKWRVRGEQNICAEDWKLPLILRKFLPCGGTAHCAPEMSA